MASNEKPSPDNRGLYAAFLARQPAVEKTDMPKVETARRLSRQETHDLGQIIKERVKVLLAHAEQQAKECMAQFERHLATIYKYDQDEVWKKATEEAMQVVKSAQERIDARCVKVGIPKDMSPQLELSWEGRGQMRTSSRRAELTRVAKSEVEAMLAAAKTSIQKQSLDLRTQVVGMGLMTPAAKLFLESLAPVEEAMHELDFGRVETKMLEQRKRRGASPQIGFYGYGEDA
jgi:vacuolar-type H+-ATPase subunit H